MNLDCVDCFVMLTIQSTSISKTMYSRIPMQLCLALVLRLDSIDIPDAQNFLIHPQHCLLLQEMHQFGVCKCSSYELPTRSSPCQAQLSDRQWRLSIPFAIRECETRRTWQYWSFTLSGKRVSRIDPVQPRGSRVPIIRGTSLQLFAFKCRNMSLREKSQPVWVWFLYTKHC